MPGVHFGGLRPHASPLGSRSTLIAALLAAACALRLLLGVTTAWNWDEEREWVYTADAISFVPGRISTPYRIANHPTGGAYGMSAGMAALPGTRVGPRLGGILVGSATVLLAATMAGALGGPAAAVWTAALVAFNEYHMAVSAMALELVYYVAFGMFAVFAFWRFLETDRDRWLYAAAVSLGYAYFCKEIAALIGPVLLAALIRRDGLRWLWRGRSWLAAGIVVLFVVPDYLSFGATPESALLPADHVSRIKGLGLRYHPTMFYLYDAVRWAFERLGRDFYDAGLGGYPHTNLVAGALMLGGTAWALLVGQVWRHQLGALLLAVFATIFSWFTFIETDGGTRGLDPIGWQWVDLTLVPATVFTGTWLSRQAGRWRALTWGAAALALAVAAVETVTTRLNTSALSAAACPEHVLATGALQEVRFELGSCDVCATPEARVASVAIVGPLGQLRPAAADEFEVVANGPAPRVRLQAASLPGENWGRWPGPWSAGEPARRYTVTLEPTTPGAAAWQRAAEPDAIEVEVFIMPRPFEPHYRPVFACRPAAN